MEVVGLIGAVGTLAETFGQGLKKLRKSYKTVKTFEVTVDDDLLNANVQATKLQIWGENLDAASVSPDALQLFPTIIDRAQEHIGEIAEVLGRYTSDVGDKGSNDGPKDIKSIVKGLGKLELKTKIKFATADHKRLKSLTSNLAGRVNHLYELAPPSQRNNMDLRLQNTLIDSTADPVELQKIATMHQQFISQDIAMSAGIKVSLLSHSWRQQPCLKEIEYDTNDLSNTREWDGKGIADLDSRQVLLEWRPKSHVLDPMEMRRRVTDIVGLLHDTNATKPKTLLVPDCTGYIDRTAYGDEQRCIGVIYNYPETFNTNQPYSLFEVLSPKEIRYHEAPPLEIRQGMARSLALTIYQIHVTGWLHKGIRPHNLIFFDAEEKCPSLIRTQAVSRMRLIGFDYSRPDTRDQKSEETDPAFDLYRHPQAQGSPRERFCKAFDLYALGLVLLEIGFWERLGNQLKLYRQKYDNDGQAKLRSHLVHARGPMKQLPFLMGTPYHDAIKLCLNAPLPVPGEEGQESNQTMVEILHNLS